MNSAEEIAVDDPVAPAGVGDRLRAAREAQGLSVADIARTLKFSIRQIELIEGNAWAELPGQTFVRGCVGNYARMLQIDPQPLLKDLESANLPKAAVLVLPGATNAVLPARAAADRKDFTTVLSGLLLMVVAVAAYFLVPEDFWQGRTSVISPRPVAATLVTPPPAVEAVAPARLPPAVAPAEAGQATAVAETAPTTPSAALRFEFDQASWVEVRDSNGALLHSQNNAAGTFQEVTGAFPLSIVIGDARRVRMIYKAQPVDLAPFTNPQNNVARLNVE